MKRKTGQGALKNLFLLSRSIINISSFALLWYGLAVSQKAGAAGAVYIAAGALMTGVCLSFNFILPMLRRKK